MTVSPAASPAGPVVARLRCTLERQGFLETKASGNTAERQRRCAHRWQVSYSAAQTTSAVERSSGRKHGGWSVGPVPARHQRDGMPVD